MMKPLLWKEDVSVRLAYKEFQKMMGILSFLHYFWSIYQKDSQSLSQTDIKRVHRFIEQGQYQHYRRLRPSRLTRKIELSMRQYRQLRRLVRITNKLERHIFKRTVEVGEVQNER